MIPFKIVEKEKVTIFQLRVLYNVFLQTELILVFQKLILPRICDNHSIVFL